MALTPEAVMDLLRAAVDELPDGSISDLGRMRLLAGLCDRIGRVAASERLASEGRQYREAADMLTRLHAGAGVRLNYVYSHSTTDGYVELTTVNAAVCGEMGESGTVVGTPGQRLRFDAHEARRAVRILRSLDPGAGRDAEPGAAPDPAA